MNFRKILLSTTILSFAVFLPIVSQAQIEPELPKKQKFNPDFIISDKQLQNEDSMNKQAIQSFLEERNSFLANYTTKNKQGNTSTAAKIIYNAAQKNKINPKYLLVKLQKEQSLIEDPSPTQKQLNWAAGYGVCDSCTLSDVGVQQHKGFTNQVHSAAGIMRWYYNHVSNKGFIKKPKQNYQIDGENIDPDNYATAFLYTYTPHIQGNKNFWKLWHDWFEQIYPDGSLLKPRSSSNVYLIRNKKKYKFSNLPALTSRFHKDRIIEVPKSELARYEYGGKIALPNYSILKSKGKYYLLDNQTIRPFANSKTVRNLGYHPAEVIKVEEKNLSKFKQGAVITSQNINPKGELIKTKPGGGYYYIKNDKYHLLIDKKIAQINFPNLKVQTKPKGYLEQFKPGSPAQLEDGVIFGIRKTGKIYMVENGKRRHIKNEKVFHQLGLEWNDVNWLKYDVIFTLDEGEPIKFSSKRIKSIPPKNKKNNQKTSAENKQKKDNNQPKDKKISRLEQTKEKIIKTPKNKTSRKGKYFSTPIESYVVMDYDTEKILSAKNSTFSRPMASLVKPITTFRLLVEGYQPNTSIEYKPQNHKGMYNRFNVSKGDKIKSKHLLDAFLIGSYNIAGRMLVDKYSKDKNNFITRMNKQLNSWGFQSSKIVDITGEKVSNRTTAREYANLFKRLTKYPKINTHLSQQKYVFSEVTSTDKHKKHIQKNTNELLRKDFKKITVLAGKTGFLHEAGTNLALLVKDKTTDEKYIIVTMGNPQITNKFSEPKRLANWTVKNF